MDHDLPVIGCFVRKTGDNRVAQVIGHTDDGQIQVSYGSAAEPAILNTGEWQCGIQPSFVVQDIPLSNARKTLGVGTAVAVREIAGREQVSVQLHSTGETRWLPFERLRRIMDPVLQYVRREQLQPDSAERTALNLMAQALRTWNEATGALERLDVDPLPHQITLVHRILSSGNINWLIADDVGLGKTIEVGLLLGALERRQNLRRVLIVVPSGLTQQWKEELLVKFGQLFRIYGTDFEVSHPNEWGLYDRVIVSLDLAKPRNSDDDGMDFDTRFGKFAQAGKWDLVVIDEAHRLSRDEAGRATLRFRLGHTLRDQTDSLLLLSGTPHQGDTGKFQNLLRLVRPDLGDAIETIDEDPSFIADLVLRNRKIDAVDAAGNFIFHGLLVRLVEIAPSEPVAKLESLLSTYLARGYAAGDRQGGKRGRAIGFVMTIYRKLASSSVYALAQALVRRRQRLLGEIVKASDYLDPDDFVDAEVETDDPSLLDADAEGREFFDQELAALDLVLAQARLCFSADHKLTELRKLTNDLVKRQHERLLIFTEYRATQHYLAACIERFLGISPALIHGGMSVDEKQAAIAAFETKVPIMISTEAGGEGLNLHRKCHVMINYDLPWNPARLTQRIGRLYRYGQQEQVVVINFAARDTIDNDILANVLHRLEHVVKQMAPVSSEFSETDRYRADILGELLERIDISDLLAEARTGRVERSAERIAEAIDRAERARLLQDDILTGAGAGEPESWRHLGSFTTGDLAHFIHRASTKLGVTSTIIGNDEEIFDLRLPEMMRGQFPEFGRRLSVEARTKRDANTARLLLDFSSSFVRYLVGAVTDQAFGGSYGFTVRNDISGSVSLACLVHYQNEQGDRRGLELIAATYGRRGIEVDNSILRNFFGSVQQTGTPPETLPTERKDHADALIDRLELRVAENCSAYRHANGIFLLGILEA